MNSSTRPSPSPAADVTVAIEHWLDDLEAGARASCSEGFVHLHRTVRPELAEHRAMISDDDEAAVGTFLDREAELEREFFRALWSVVRPAMRDAALDASRCLGSQQLAGVPPDVLAGIRRFYLDDVRETYRLAELAEMWRQPVSVLAERCDPVEIREQGVDRADFVVDREWAAFLLSRCASPSVVECALGSAHASAVGQERETRSVRASRSTFEAIAAVGGSRWSVATLGDALDEIIADGILSA